MRPLPDYRPPTRPWVDEIYADGQMVALHKPAGLLSVPGNVSRDSLDLRALDRYGDALIAHRLDMATSGVVVFGRGKANLARLGRQFELRQTAKTYVAVVDGEVEAEEGTIDLPMRCDWPNRPLQMVDHERGKAAITRWRVVSRAGGRTRLELTPITGRSHQLRLHCQKIGHPILGDPWYAPDDVAGAAPRLLLHAERLTVAHPATDEPMTFTAPCPF